MKVLVLVLVVLVSTAFARSFRRGPGGGGGDNSRDNDCDGGRDSRSDDGEKNPCKGMVKKCRCQKEGGGQRSELRQLLQELDAKDEEEKCDEFLEKYEVEGVDSAKIKGECCKPPEEKDEDPAKRLLHLLRGETVDEDSKNPECSIIMGKIKDAVEAEGGLSKNTDPETDATDGDGNDPKTPVGDGTDPKTPVGDGTGPEIPDGELRELLRRILALRK